MNDTQSKIIKKEYNKKLGIVDGNAADMYKPVVVCSRCFKVYSTLDKARELLSEIKNEKKSNNNDKETNTETPLKFSPIKRCSTASVINHEKKPSLLPELQRNASEPTSIIKSNPSISNFNNSQELYENKPKNNKLSPIKKGKIKHTIVIDDKEYYQGSILIVDNDKPSIITTKNILETEQYYIEVVSDGPQALIACRKKYFDVVLMEKDLPTLGCIEFTRLIREKELNSNSEENLNIFAFTSYDKKNDVEKYLNVGMNGCISKPVDKDILISTMKNTIPLHKTLINKSNEDRICSVSGGKPSKPDLSKIPTIKQRCILLLLFSKSKNSFNTDQNTYKNI